VDIFRRVEFIPGIVDAAMRAGAKAIWMQDGLAHNASAEKARAAGLEVVMSRCMMRDYRTWHTELDRARSWAGSASALPDRGPGRRGATLLTTDEGNLSVRIDCIGDKATVRAVAGGRTQSTSLTLSGENAREALLAAVERTLEALERAGEPGTAPHPAPAGTSPAQAAGTTPPSANPEPEPEPEPAPAPVPPPTERDARSFQVGAGVLGELWDGAFGLGARLAAERRLSPFSLGVALGWLRALAGDEPFRADELHAFAYGGLEERSTGLHCSLGAGISVLTVTPDPEVVAQSPTTLSLVMFELGLSRPVRFGRASLLPAVGLRVFPARREVNVDATHRLVLPPLCPSLFLGLGYEL
jgi:cell division septation protein DedD